MLSSSCWFRQFSTYGLAPTRTRAYATRVARLGSCSSTIELHPPGADHDSTTKAASRPRVPPLVGGNARGNRLSRLLDAIARGNRPPRPLDSIARLDARRDAGSRPPAPQQPPRAILNAPTDPAARESARASPAASSTIAGENPPTRRLPPAVHPTQHCGAQRMVHTHIHSWMHRQYSVISLWCKVLAMWGRLAAPAAPRNSITNLAD